MTYQYYDIADDLEKKSYDTALSFVGNKRLQLLICALNVVGNKRLQLLWNLLFISLDQNFTSL